MNESPAAMRKRTPARASPLRNWPMTSLTVMGGARPRALLLGGCRAHLLDLVFREHDLRARHLDDVLEEHEGVLRVLHRPAQVLRHVGLVIEGADGELAAQALVGQALQGLEDRLRL